MVFRIQRMGWVIVGAGLTVSTIGLGTVGSRLGTDGACIRRKGFISM